MSAILSIAEPGQGGRPSLGRMRAALSYAANAFIASVLLMLLAPMILCIAACICIETGRPVFFLQTRLGRDGRPFRLLKFRKFHNRLGAMQLPLTLRNDPRLTRVGWFLERSKLDEVPQLWNIVQGEMAFVGPRPESLAFADCFTEEFRAVLDHPPGIFGPSQALFRDEAALYRGDWDPEVFYRAVLFPAKARIDLSYYPSRTVMRDVLWVFHGTVAVMGCAPVSRRVAMIAHDTAELIRRIGDREAPLGKRSMQGGGTQFAVPRNQDSGHRR